MSERAIETPIDYYADPAVSGTLLSCWGCPVERYPAVSLPEPEAAGCLERCTVQYLAVTSTRIAAEKWGGVPVRAVQRRQLPTLLQKELRAGDGALEINQPLGYFRVPEVLADRVAEEQVPERTLLFLDFEVFNEEDATWAFRYPQQAFETLEPTYRIVSEYFVEKGIDALVAMSGRGYHFVCHVPFSSQMMGKLVHLGYSLSPEVRHFLDYPRPDSKRDEPIPWNTERAFWGARQLEHYIYTETIGKARTQTGVPVEMSDRGRFGVSFDATSMNRTTETAGFGTPAAIYTKPHVRYHFGGRFPTRSIRAVIQDGEVQAYGPLEQMLVVREDYREAVANAAWLMALSPAGIPDGSAGLERLLAGYEQSALAGFHRVMNDHYRLDEGQWEQLVADVGRAALEDPRVGRALRRPYPSLLDPDLLNQFTFALFERWEPEHGLHAFKRVAFVLSGFYYNEPALLRQFEYAPIDWEKTFNHEVPQRHAQAWVTILGGQLFEQ